LQGEDSDALAAVMPWNGQDEYAQATDGIERIAALYAEKQYEAKLLDQELQNLAVSLKEAIGENAGIVGAGWSATWKQNKPSRKVDYAQILAKWTVPQDVIDEATREVPGARVFRFKKEADGE
jgi:hypothetical protein